MFDGFIEKLNSLDLQEYDEYVNCAVQEAAKEEGVDLKKEQPSK